MKKNSTIILLPSIFVGGLIACICFFIASTRLISANTVYKNIYKNPQLAEVDENFDDARVFPIRFVILQDIASATLMNQGNATTLLPYMKTVTDALERFNTTYPDFFQAHLALARLYDQWGVVTGGREKFTLAQKEYEIALAMVPKHQEILYPYAFNTYYRGDTKKALSIMEQAYESGPHVASTEYFYGTLLINDGEKQYNKALSLIEDAFIQGFDPPEKNVFEVAYGRLFFYYYKLGKFDEFKKVIYRLSSVPNSQQDMFIKIKQYVQETGKIPVLNIKEQ